MAEEANLSGVLVLDKPVGPTSHDVVARVRRILKTKVGHTGTLDPAASGVLPLVLGSATRLARFLLASDKVYQAEIRLGIETDTYDAEGRTVREQPVPALTTAAIEDCLKGFRGSIEQVPPMYSAIKIRGERLYKAARRNESVERPARKIEMFRLEAIAFQDDLLTLEAHCSSGTYIRSLAHDIGQHLGCGAHLQALRRTRTGEFDLSTAVTLEQVATEAARHVIPPEQLLTAYPRIDLDETLAEKVRHGAWLSRAEAPGGEFPLQPVCRLFSAGELLALAEGHPEGLKPFLVFQAR